MLRRQWAVLRRYPDYRKLWIGQSISSCGTAITTLALPLTAVVLLKASPFQMGLLGAAGLVPHLVFGLASGVWVDRLPRRPILIAADLLRAALLGSVPVLALLGALRIADLYAVAFLTGVCALFFDVAVTSFVPTLVERDDLLEANTATSLSGSVASAAGPALAGALVQALTAPVAIVFDALSFVGSAVCSALIGTPEPAASPLARRGIVTEVVEGIRAIADDPILRDMVGSTAVGSLGGAVQQAVLVLFLARELGLTPPLLGAVFSAYGITAVLGALLAGPVRERCGFGAAIVGGSALWWVSSLLLAFVAGPLLVVMPLLVAVQAVRGIAIPVYSISQITVRQAMLPSRLLGRVNATRRLLVFGIIPIGSLIGGTLGQIAGLRQALVVGALIQGLCLLWLVLSPIHGLRDAPRLSDTPAEAS